MTIVARTLRQLSGEVCRAGARSAEGGRLGNLPLPLSTQPLTPVSRLQTVSDGMRRFAVCVLLFGAPVAFAGQNRADPDFVRAHDDALRRAQVWIEPETPIERAALGRNPEDVDHYAHDGRVECRFKPGGVSGSTPKFDCTLRNGKTVKVKYGAANPEVYSEVIASRLLAALGFPADRMYVVEVVHCYGCTADPFVSLQCVNEGKSIDDCLPDLDYSAARDFSPAVIERPIDGRRIETAKDRGWAWNELNKIDPAAGGAPQAHVDALRLMAVLLNHWDNKAKNQRLLCLGESDPPGRVLKAGPCKRPLAMVQDLGATFGPDKLDLQRWASSPVWTDSASCMVSMKKLPYGGSTFPDTTISEVGRQFLAERLTRLSASQVRDLFEGARIAQYPHRDRRAANSDEWVRAFQAKVRSIADRKPCPAQ